VTIKEKKLNEKMVDDDDFDVRKAKKNVIFYNFSQKKS
jgi:hypothetical protein